MKLGKLIAVLKTIPADTVIRCGFGEPGSYRGYYRDLAFAPAADVTAGSMLSYAESAVGKTFFGYKGGEYLMDADTDCWIAEYGQYGGDSADGISRTLVDYWKEDAR